MAHRGSIRDLYWAGVVYCLTLLASAQAARAQDEMRLNEGFQRFLAQYCFDCHNESSKDGGLDLESLSQTTGSPSVDIWENVVRKLSSQQMPPPGELRPSDAEYLSALESLTKPLDGWAKQHPDPGYVETIRRLTRTEYTNSIRDLLDLDVDIHNMLPGDESSHGFDNVTVTNLSPSLLERYVSAAREISRLAVGVRAKAGDEIVYRIPPDVTQDVHIAGAPMGSRGGAVFEHHFPQDGDYEIQIHLMRDRNDEIESLRGKHKIDVLIDRECKGTVEFERPPAGTSDKLVDADLKVHIHMAAGAHQVAVVFPEQVNSLLESVRQPLNVHYNFYRHPRIGPAIYQISIRGPFDGTRPVDTSSRGRVFSVYPQTDSEQLACAEQIISTLARRAYRRDLTEADMVAPMQHFQQAAKEGGFDVGIESALSAVLVSPHFLFRIERQPSDVAPSGVHPVGDFELATRLSYFLWSSLPDEELLMLAESGRLSQPDVLKQQTTRMLADRHADALVTNFADQWLYLRNLDAVTPDARLFPDFDQNLRDAFRRETELLFADMLHEDHSVLLLLDSRSTWLNERLARHYGIPHVIGDHFRRVAVEPDQHRGGILRHGSILSVTSYATRTSPVLRGKWVLENLLGSPPPPPPPDVPTLQDNSVAATLPLRERLSAHRENQACAVCHDRIDPVGFALENFDAVGRWRESELEHSVDASGGLPDGRQFVSVSGLEAALLQRPEVFVRTVTEKLLIYALGRGLNPEDGAAVRRIVSDASEEDFRFSSIVHGIVQSVPFRMRERQRP
ncbi:MAG: DUF1592 domain-containing protein [Planctomycetaceae bacterium]|nr:DUF1592 domain-containing protein [Planctomycetaceae bacterium]